MNEEKPVTADEMKREFEDLARKARGQLDLSKINPEKMAEIVNRAKANHPPGWESPPPPKGWLEKARDFSGAMYINPERRLKVILSCSIYGDGRAWMHLSLSHTARERLPTWGELVTVRDAFLGERETYQIIPPPERYVNIDRFVLNVYALWQGGSVMPDFTRGSGGI